MKNIALDSINTIMENILTIVRVICFLTVVELVEVYSLALWIKPALAEIRMVKFR